MTPPPPVPASREDRRLKALGLVMYRRRGIVPRLDFDRSGRRVAAVFDTSSLMVAGICLLAVNLLVGRLARPRRRLRQDALGERAEAPAIGSDAPHRSLANVLAPAVLMSFVTDDPVLEAKAEREGWYGWLSAVAVVLMLVAWRLWRRSRQYGALGADEAMARDPRPPVLYLRSFADDGDATLAPGRSALVRYGQQILAPVTPEQEMADILADVGPVVAIGKPGEPLPELGAARLYVADADWQAQSDRADGRGRLGRASARRITRAAVGGRAIAFAPAAPPARVRGAWRLGDRTRPRESPCHDARADLRPCIAAGATRRLAGEVLRRSAPSHRRLRLFRPRRHRRRGSGPALAARLAGRSFRRHPASACRAAPPRAYAMCLPGSESARLATTGTRGWWLCS